MPALPVPLAAAPPAAVAAIAQPVSLWGQAAQFMSPAQVQVLYPQATPTPAVVLADGAVARLGYVAALSTGPAQVVFYFRGEELDAVLVQALEVRPGGLKGLGMARRLEGALSQTYGPPTFHTDASHGGLTAINSQWTAQPLKVSLAYEDVGGRRRSLVVAFRARSWDARQAPRPPRRFGKTH